MKIYYYAGIILLLVFKFKGEELTNSDEDIENPFELFDNRDNKNGNETPDDDDDPFRLVRTPKENKNYSKEEFTIDILWHAHLIKIFWNKINDNKILRKKMESKNYPIDVTFKLQLTEEMINDLQKYANNSNENSSSRINDYFLNLLKLEEKTEHILLNDERQEWYETKYFLFLVLPCLASFIILPKGKFVMLILGLTFAHKGYEIYNDKELEKSFIISHDIPEHCLIKKNKSIWQRLLVWWNTNKECVQYYKALNKQTFFSVNPIKVLAAMVSDFFLELSNGISELTGINYRNLSNYLPWYLTPIFTIILFLAPIVFVGYIFINLFTIWLKHSNPASTHCTILEDQNHGRHARRLRVPLHTHIQSRKKILYKNK